MLLNECLCCCYSLFDGFSVKIERFTIIGNRSLSCSRRIDNNTFFSIITLFTYVSTLDKWDDRQIEVFCKGIVTRVVSWYSHNSSCAISSKHIFTNPDRILLSSKWIYSVRTREDTCYLMVYHSLTFCATLYVCYIFVNFSLLIGCSEFFYQF